MKPLLPILLSITGILQLTERDACGQTLPAEEEIAEVIGTNQFDLNGDGQNFLLTEAFKSEFFLLGELHGENEVPALLHTLWPQMWKDGYRHVAAEVSPWAAYQLEFVPPGTGPDILGLWTKREALDLHASAKPHQAILWGCDMEEGQPELLIRELAMLNPGDPKIQRMVELTKAGYKRGNAADLLSLLRAAQSIRNKKFRGQSLRQNLLDTLQIETYRSDASTRMMAQNARELLMKQKFLAYSTLNTGSAASPKVLFRFGRSHLHRGYDARGISTLGNFVAELAFSHGRKVFNVGTFAAGGQAKLAGKTFEADERPDELAFAFLAANTKHAATIFDLRPLRPLLHNIPQSKRSMLQANLTYWADSYDALICYRTVTPLSL